MYMSTIDNTNTKKPKRIYKRITPQVIVEHKAKAILTNNSEALRLTDSDYKTDSSLYSRASKIAKKSITSNAIEYIDNRLQQIGIKAIDKLDELIDSDNEVVSGINTRYAIDHIRGKAVQRTDNRNINISIESILD